MAGYYMGSRGRFDWITLLHTMLGTFLTASSAGVLNQVIERPDNQAIRGMVAKVPHLVEIVQ